MNADQIGVLSVKIRVSVSDQKEKLSIGLFRLADPLVCPAHSAHHVPLIIHFDDFDQFARVTDDVVQLFSRCPST